MVESTSKSFVVAKGGSVVGSKNPSANLNKESHVLNSTSNLSGLPGSDYLKPSTVVSKSVE